MSDTMTIRTADPPTATAAAVSARETPTRVLRLAVAGCGTVGGALLRLLREEAASIEQFSGVRVEVVRVLVRDTSLRRALELPPGLLTADLHRFLATDADVIVEAIGGVDTAAAIAAHAVTARRAFVTANKALIAERGPQLAALAAAQRTSIAFEAAVAGGVPVLRVLRESLPHTGVRSIRGILNGTTNYVLTRMEAGVPFAAAVAQAQAAGFAEADPARDLDGRDAADKITILAWQALGVAPDRLNLQRQGLLPEPDRIVADAAALGGAARLIAECVRLPGGAAAAVEPVTVSPDSAFARTSAEDNLVEIETASTGAIRLAGPGAGGRPTASALLSDVLYAAAPPRQAGTGATAAPDPRRLSWSISIPGEAHERRMLERTAERLRLELDGIAGLSGCGVIRARLAECDRTAARAFVRDLELHALRPLLLRCESDLPLSTTSSARHTAA